MKKKVLGITVVAILIGCAFIGYTQMNKKEISEFEKSVNKITEIDYSDQKSALDKLVEEGLMNVQYSPNVTIKDGVSTDFNIKNIKNNHYPIAFEILSEDGKSLYKSKSIDLGYELSSLELAEQLSKGTYNCKIKIGYVEEGNVSSVFPITIEVL